MIKEQCIDTIEAATLSFGDRITWNKWLKAGVRLLAEDVRKVLKVPVTWQRRARDRHQLAQMSDAMLKDIGLGRVDVRVESAKPFWRG